MNKIGLPGAPDNLVLTRIPLFSVKAGKLESRLSTVDDFRHELPSTHTESVTYVVPPWLSAPVVFCRTAMAYGVVKHPWLIKLKRIKKIGTVTLCHVVTKIIEMMAELVRIVTMMMLVLSNLGNRKALCVISMSYHY